MTRQATTFKRLLRNHSILAVAIAMTVFGAAVWFAWPQSDNTYEATAEIKESPSSFSDADIALYKTAFNLQDAGDSDGADASIKQISNTRLVGYVLAERYLSAKYNATGAESTEWLAHYSDHPQAAQIAKLATRHGVKVAPIENETPLKGEGYADNIGRSTMPDSWYRGLTLWREKNYSAALPLFAAIGANEDGSNWQRSAGYYWAYRAATKLNDTDVANRNLALAANFHTTFYGLLALQQTDELPELTATAPPVSSSLRNNPQVIRAALLAQIDRGDDAEEEVRRLYSNMDVSERPGLVTLAHEMNLPNLQVRLARMPQLTESQALYASYPMPSFMVEAKPDSNPALMLAIARNESSFRESAASGSGAVGLMQMLPSTAHAVERRVGRELLSTASADGAALGMRERLNDPATSVRFGAEYVKILMAEPAVGNNLMRVLAAYNAGSGTVAGWQSASRQIDDPLLYVESIPYPETHNYVMQVMAQYWVYQTLMGEKPSTLGQVAEGKWPQLGAAGV